MSDLDALIDSLVSDSMIETGAKPEWLEARGMIARPRIRQKADQPRGPKPPRWTDEEERFYSDHLSDMTLAEIARALGRSEAAVKCHRFRAGLGSHRRAPGYLTTYQVAVLLGIDGHIPPVWVDHGIMPGELVPYENKRMRRVRLEDFKRWLVRPETWVYIRVERIRNPSLRRLVQIAQQRWGDEWWSTRQAADYHGLTSSDICRQIKLGRIEGIQAYMRGGRDTNPSWALWFVRKSEVMRLHIDACAERGGWTPRSDAYILRAMTEGMIYADIAARMKWSPKRVSYRASRLKKQMTPVGERMPEDGADCIVVDDRGNVWKAIYTAAGWLVMVNTTSQGEPGKIRAWTRWL